MGALMPVENINGLRVLTLSGTPEQMGEEHGTLLGEEIRTHVMEFLRRGKRLYGVPYEQLRDMGTQLLQWIPDVYLREMRAIAKASDVSFEDILALNCLVDIDAVYGAVGHCCNFLVRGKASASELLIHGRNLDFPHGNILQKVSWVIIRRPKDTQTHNTIGIAWSGFVGFFTGYSAAQISVGEVGTPVSNPKLSGIPFSILLRNTLEQCSTISECGKHVEQSHRTCGYNIVFCSGRDKDALAVECTPTLIGKRSFRKDFLVVDGICLTPKTARNRSVMTADAVRHARMTHLVVSHTGRIDVSKGLEFLRDRFDGVWGKHGGRGYNSICNNQTVHSVLFLPAKKKLFIAQGSIPAPIGDYHELSAEAL